MEVRPRVSETDMLEHVNNTSYFVYLEEARIAFLKERGIDIRQGNYSFVLVSVTCDFIRQSFYNDMMPIRTTVQDIGRTSLTLISDITDKASGDFVAKGKAIIVHFDTEQQKAVSLPDEFKTTLRDDSLFK